MQADAESFSDSLGIFFYFIRPTLVKLEAVFYNWAFLTCLYCLSKDHVLKTAAKGNY